MKKLILKNKFKSAFVLLLFLFLLISLSVAYNRSLINNWNPPESLVGEWSGQSEVFAPFKKGQPPSVDPEDWINIQIAIEADGKVTGKIGDAEFVNCTVKQNRTWFERLIGIKTDYIIGEGYLDNGIVPDDTAIKRDISIPFNISDGTLKGSVFEVEKWKYPDPLFPRLLLAPVEK